MTAFEQLITAARQGEFKFWEDPGHGWFQAPLQLVRDTEKEKNIKISKYSYMDEKYAYLEEDADFPAFVNAFPAMNFQQEIWPYVQREHKDDIFIRDLNSYRS